MNKVRFAVGRFKSIVLSNLTKRLKKILFILSLLGSQLEAPRSFSGLVAQYDERLQVEHEPKRKKMKVCFVVTATTSQQQALQLNEKNCEITLRKLDFNRTNSSCCVTTRDLF